MVVIQGGGRASREGLIKEASEEESGGD